MTPQRPRPPAPRPAPPRRRRDAAPETPATPTTPTERVAPDAVPRTAPTRTAPTGTPRSGPSQAGAARAGATTGTAPTGTARAGAARASTGAARASTGAVGTAPTRSTPAGASPGRRTSGRTAATSSAAAPGTDVAARTGSFPVRPPVVSQGSAARFAERARARRMLAWRQIVGVVGGVVVVGALVWLLLFSPVLALDTAQVRVDGAGTVVAVDQVRAVVDEHEGVPLPRLDVTGLRAALLDVPGVRDVTLVRDWPRGLSVQLVSREPVAAVPESADVVEGAPGTEVGGTDPGAQEVPADGADGDVAGDEAAGPGYALVDQDGVKVGRSDAPPEGLPVVEVPVGEARILAAALGVLESVPEALLVDIGQVSATTQDTVRFVLRDGATVEWGSAQEPDLKAAVLGALRAAPETAGSARYDVSAPTMPVVG